MFVMALTRPSLTMQLTSGVDVFAHVCGQKADNLSKYFDNIQPYERDVSVVFFQIWDKFLIVLFGNCHKFELVNLQGSAATYWRYDGKYYTGLVGNLVLFQWWKKFENPLSIEKVIDMNLVYYFFWDTVFMLDIWYTDNETVYSTWNDLQRSLKTIGDFILR